jgi:cytochrome c554/c'-like protein
MTTIRKLFGGLVLLSALAFVATGGGGAQAASDPAAVMGPNACAECHKIEAEVWKGTKHFSTFRALPRSKEARAIAKKMGVRRLKAASLCLDCHFTTKKVGAKVKAIAGISCESCHSSAKKWIKVHSGFSGKKKATESAAEAKIRWEKAEAGGMIRPNAMYDLAKNCYACHVVPREKLVNVGGHSAGSKFELVSWSQGQIRHNLWYANGKENKFASTERRRLMFVVGLAVELETALRAVGKATQKKTYAVKMARRASKARKRLSGAAKILSNVPELREAAKAANAAGLKLNNDAELSAAADKVAAAGRRIASKYDGSTFAAIDKAIPGPDKYKGKPVR